MNADAPKGSPPKGPQENLEAYRPLRARRHESKNLDITNIYTFCMSLFFYFQEVKKDPNFILHTIWHAQNPFKGIKKINLPIKSWFFSRCLIILRGSFRSLKKFSQNFYNQSNIQNENRFRDCRPPLTTVNYKLNGPNVRSNSQSIYIRLQQYRWSTSKMRSQI